MLVDLVQSGVWPRYKAIVQAVSNAVASKVLRPGDRLPTQRELSDQLGWAVATIGRAYSELEALGVITSRVGSGTFVASSGGAREVSLKSGIDLATYKVPIPPIREALTRSMANLFAGEDPSLVLGASPAAGLHRHREAVALWLGRQGVSVDPSQVIITNGGQHSTMSALSTLTHEGEALATDELTDPRMKAVAAYLGRRLVPVAMDDDGMLPDALDQCCRTEKPVAIYVTTRCQNPTTATLPLDRRVAIAEIARRYDLPIIESDIYGSLHDDPAPQIISLAPERTHHVGAFGRIAGPGMKVGWLVSPASEVARTQAGVGMSTGSASLINVEIACGWVADGTMETLAQWQKAEVARRLATLARFPHLSAARSEPLCAHIWMQLPDRWRAEELVEQAALHHISIAPTHSFLVGRGSTPHAVRLCIGSPADLGELEAAAERIERLLSTAPRVRMQTA